MAVDLGMGVDTRVTHGIHPQVVGSLEEFDEDTRPALQQVVDAFAPLKASVESVQFAFSPEASITTQIEQVLAAVAAGEVPPDVGTQIISAINTLSQARVTEELADKVPALPVPILQPGRAGDSHVPRM